MSLVLRQSFDCNSRIWSHTSKNMVEFQLLVSQHWWCMQLLGSTTESNSATWRSELRGLGGDVEKHLHLILEEPFVQGSAGLSVQILVMSAGSTDVSREPLLGSICYHLTLVVHLMLMELDNS